MNKTFIEEQQKIAREKAEYILYYFKPSEIDTLISQTILATEAEIVKNGCVNYEIE